MSDACRPTSLVPSGSAAALRPGPRSERPPEEMPYRDGSPIPPGYHVESRLRKGMVIGGASTFGFLYALSIGFAAGSELPESEWLYLPIAGPLVEAALVAGRPSENRDTCIEWCGVNDTIRDVTVLLLVFDGVGQAVGAVLLGVGLAWPKQVLARDDTGGLPLTIAPMTFGQGGFGLGLAGKL